MIFVTNNFFRFRKNQEIFAEQSVDFYIVPFSENCRELPTRHVINLITQIAHSAENMSFQLIFEVAQHLDDLLLNF